MTPIDVVVAVYRGAEATRRCIESVLSATPKTSFELIVVSDGCPEAELVRWLRDQAERSRLTLIEQTQRQGFAAAVNRAVACHPERDVVILHSDAEVAHDWLDRLVAPAEQSPDVGMVVPFTNYGGIACYPMSLERNAMPEGQTLASLDLLFSRANAGASVTVPLAGAPCLFLRRRCLEAVGPFDGGPLGSDYGVEIDFCLRASGAGFRHALAADVYVWHWGEVSFGAEAQGLAARSERALGRLYPHYAALRAEFAARDPARPFRRSVDLLRLAQSPRQLLLFVAHGWGGGVRRHMEDLARMVGERCDVLLLNPAAADTVTLSWLRQGETFACYFALPADMQTLVSLLRGLALVRIHFHHVHELPRSVLDLPAQVGVPYDCTLHDYYAICPQYHLDTADGRYCGEPDARGCAACLAERPGQWGLNITAWRATLGRLLRGADRVIAPSRDVAQRIARYFPDVDALVMPHPERLLADSARVTRVMTLGNLSPEKGLRVVAACAVDASERRLPLAFRVLGTTAEPLPHWPAAPLSIHGEYDDQDLPALISAERPDVIWFPAQVPETYSYTLSAALNTGAAIVVSDLGALRDRVSAHARAMVVRWNATPAEWNDALLRAGALVAPTRPPLSRVATQ